jgi:hypothetical protein
VAERDGVKARVVARSATRARYHRLFHPAVADAATGRPPPGSRSWLQHPVLPGRPITILLDARQ